MASVLLMPSEGISSGVAALTSMVQWHMVAASGNVQSNHRPCICMRFCQEDVSQLHRPHVGASAEHDRFLICMQRHSVVEPASGTCSMEAILLIQVLSVSQDSSGVSGPAGG